PAVSPGERSMRQIGKYHVQEQIGVGGFGEVFKGFDPYIKRVVAIKTCSTHNDEIRNRFFQEAEIAGNLNHKNITTIHDFGVEGELPYLVQEYLSGEDLDHKIKRRDPLPYAEKLVYLIQIARGLAHAHEHGVIHRDIKPANIRILEDGSAKIMDFGIAKLAQQESGLTQTGMTLGTAAYLSPEQIRGEAVDSRTDIFSFGVLAYELLTYRRPFDGNQISAVLYQLLHHEPPPMREVWPDAPPGASAVVGRCLAKQAAGRYEDAGALLHALERLSVGGRAARVPGADGRSAGAPAADKRHAAAAPPPQGPRGFGAHAPDAGDEPSSLEDIEISTTLVAAPDEETIQAYTAAETRSSGALIAAVVVAALALAGIGGWWFGTQGDRGGGSAEVAASEANAEVDDEPQDVTPPTPGEPAPADAAAGDEARSPEPVKLDPGLAIIEPPAWTQEMTVSVGNGAGRALDRRRSFRLEPGTYRLHFQIDEDGYAAKQTVAVSIGEGARQVVPIPIPQPGGLSVRPQLNRPQGLVLLDGLLRGQTPLRRQLLAPKTYQVEIRPRGGADGEGVELEVEIRPGTLTVLTFDLDAGSAQRTDKALAP
ncbi:MAG: serine/threonine-protein kinase, partial [Acidobacteriota bacterium]